jgi:hypothetical protein
MLFAQFVKTKIEEAGALPVDDRDAKSGLRSK